MAGESLRIKGDIIANEDLRFEGQIEGTIRVPEHTLVVGPQAHLNVDVHARAVVVAGTLNGSVTARERFELQEQGTLDGTLEAPRLAVRDGATLRAKITMPPRTKADAKPAAASTTSAPRDEAGHASAGAPAAAASPSQIPVAS
jgi:cytoskeletal protein CcmA (bactofilin family)